MSKSNPIQPNQRSFSFQNRQTTVVYNMVYIFCFVLLCLLFFALIATMCSYVVSFSCVFITYFICVCTNVWFLSALPSTFWIHSLALTHIYHLPNSLSDSNRLDKSFGVRLNIHTDIYGYFCFFFIVVVMQHNWDIFKYK